MFRGAVRRLAVYSRLESIRRNELSAKRADCTNDPTHGHRFSPWCVSSFSPPAVRSFSLPIFSFLRRVVVVTAKNTIKVSRTGYAALSPEARLQPEEPTSTARPETASVETDFYRLSRIPTGSTSKRSSFLIDEFNIGTGRQEMANKGEKKRSPHFPALKCDSRLILYRTGRAQRGWVSDGYGLQIKNLGLSS